jgi:hypothetical protein
MSPLHVALHQAHLTSWIISKLQKDLCLPYMYVTSEFTTNKTNIKAGCVRKVANIARAREILFEKSLEKWLMDQGIWHLAASGRRRKPLLDGLHVNL